MASDRFMCWWIWMVWVILRRERWIFIWWHSTESDGFSEVDCLIDKRQDCYSDKGMNELKWNANVCYVSNLWQVDWFNVDLLFMGGLLIVLLSCWLVVCWILNAKWAICWLVECRVVEGLIGGLLINCLLKSWFNIEWLLNWKLIECRLLIWISYFYWSILRIGCSILVRFLSCVVCHFIRKFKNLLKTRSTFPQQSTTTTTT